MLVVSRRVDGAPDLEPVEGARGKDVVLGKLSIIGGMKEDAQMCAGTHLPLPSRAPYYHLIG